MAESTGETGATIGEVRAGSTLPSVEVLPPAPRFQPRSEQHSYRMPDRLRAKIQCGILLRRLHDVASGRVVAHPALLQAQIAAAKVLLAKALPDLQTVEIVGDANRPIIVLTRME